MNEKQVYFVKVKKGHDPKGVAHAHGLNGRRFWKGANGFSDEMTEKQAEQLRKHPHVEFVVEDTGTVMQDVPWHLDRVTQRAPQLDGLIVRRATGKGVAHLLDTGVLPTHVQFRDRNDPTKSRARIVYDATGGDGIDRQGHGDHCGGLIAGLDYGTAPDAEIWSYKVLNDDGQGYWEWFVDGCEKVLELGRPGDVVSISLGGMLNPMANAAVAALWDAGFHPFCAAGNNSEDASTFSPASEPKCTCVGASEIDPNSGQDARCGFSNWGARLDVFSPGRSILSVGHTSDTALATRSGTSMATPIAAGAALVALELLGPLTPTELRDALKRYATQGAVRDADGPVQDLLYTLFDSVMDPDTPVVKPPPVVTFTAEPNPDLGTYGVHFQDTSPPGQGIVDRLWNFGDGQVSGHGAGPTADHSYTAPGRYTASLEATDVERTTVVTSLEVTVGDAEPAPGPDPIPLPDPPQASYTMTAQKGIKILRLVWSGFAGDRVELHLDGRLVGTLLNNGAGQFNTGQKKPPQSVRVCEVGGTVCAAAVAT